MGKREFKCAPRIPHIIHFGLGTSLRQARYQQQRGVIAPQTLEKAEITAPEPLESGYG